MSNLTTDGTALYTSRIHGHLVEVWRESALLQASRLMPVAIMDDVVAVSPAGRVALSVKTGADHAWGCVDFGPWIDFGPAQGGHSNHVAWVDERFVFARIDAGAVDLVEQNETGQEIHRVPCSIPGTSQGILQYDDLEHRFVLSDERRDVAIGTIHYVLPVRRGAWWNGQCIVGGDHNRITHASGAPSWQSGPQSQAEQPQLAVIGERLVTNGPMEYSTAHPNQPPTVTPIPPEPPVPIARPKVTITDYQPRTGPAPLACRAVWAKETGSGPVTRVEWLIRPLGTSAWTVAANNVATDATHTYRVGAGSFEIALKGIGPGGTAQTSKQRIIRATAPTPEPPDPGPVPPIPPELPVPPPTSARLGLVRGNGFQFTDDTGGFLAWGTTLFWGAYGYVFERDRIEAHLANIQRKGIDYVRVIATGLRKGTAERSLDPSTSSYAQGIAGLTDLAYDTYGLRVQWTIFGATYDAPTKTDRARAVDTFCAALAGRTHKVHAVEIGNEAWTNGFPGDEGRDELTALVGRVRDKLPNLVAPTCPAPGDDITREKVQYYYKGTRATVITEHHARSEKPPDGVWRHTKKPWRETMFVVEGCPKLRRNQEPWGPESSGDEGNDPTVLAIDAVVTWLAGEGDYLLHCGGGIYGLADPTRGRPADLWDTENWDAICAGIKAMRAAVPADLPNFTKHKTNKGPFRFVDTPDEQLSAAYSATSGSGVGQRIVQPVWGVVKATTFTLQDGRCTGTMLDPATGAVLATFDRSFTVTPQQRAVVVVATRTA